MTYLHRTFYYKSYHTVCFWFCRCQRRIWYPEWSARSRRRWWPPRRVCDRPGRVRRFGSVAPNWEASRGAESTWAGRRRVHRDWWASVLRRPLSRVRYALFYSASFFWWQIIITLHGGQDEDPSSVRTLFYCNPSSETRNAGNFRQRANRIYSNKNLDLTSSKSKF